MSERARITVAFQSWWLASTGGAGGGDVDDIVRRDAAGCPALPMSTLRGTLRESAERLAQQGAADWTDDLVDLLFGRRAGQEGTTQGALVFAGEARLAEPLRRFFGENPNLRAELFDRHAGTAIDHGSGVAAARALRSFEVAAPLTLQAFVRQDPSRLPGEAAKRIPGNWAELLDAAAAFTFGLGKGKGDGLGRAIVKIEAVDEPQAPASPGAEHAAQNRPANREDSRGMAVVLLTQTEKAVFTARSATEGVHDTLRYIPGNTLLGWAARQYERFGDKAFDIFHSGRVRFGDGLPIASDGSLALPTPQVLRESKLNRDGIERTRSDEGELQWNKVTLRRTEGEQREVLKKPFVTPSGKVPEIPLALDQRTAMRDGRSLRGALFGYTSLKAAPEEPKNFAAVIEADRDALDDGFWTEILDAFDGQEVMLGRAAGAGHGGVFRCRVVGADRTPYAAPPPESHSGRVVVWAISDLALLDAFGEPLLRPQPEDLGLGRGRLIIADSAISTRRYAPWNRLLDSRDVERAVIAAGSVLVFDLEAESLQTPWPETVGCFREAGLGRIWIDPPMLKGLLDLTSPPHPKEDEPNRVPAALNVAEVATDAQREPSDPLIGWTRDRAERRRAAIIAADHSSKWVKEMIQLYNSYPQGVGPSASQWSDVRRDAAAARSLEELREAVAARRKATDAEDWGKEGRIRRDGGPAEHTTFRDWLAARLATADLSLDAANLILEDLQKRAGRHLRAREGRG